MFVVEKIDEKQNFENIMNTCNDKESCLATIIKNAESNELLKEYLGDLYSKGQYVEKNITKSLEWYLSAYDDGDMISGFKYADLMIKNPETFQKGILFLNEMADKGNIHAMLHLFQAYQYRDVEKAIMWLTKVCTKTKDYDVLRLRIMSKSNIAEYQNKAYDECSLLSKTNNNALGLLAEMLYYGRGTNKDVEKAIKILRNLSKFDYSAYIFLIKILCEGNAVHKTEALELCKKAIMIDDPRILEYLAKLFFEGQIVDKDVYFSVALLTRAKEKGLNVNDQLKQYIRECEDEYSRDIYRKLLRDGSSTEDLYLLGKSYEEETCGNYRVAVDYYIKAATKGDEKSVLPLLKLVNKYEYRDLYETIKELLIKFKDKDDDISYYYAEINYEGKIVKKNYDVALKTLKQIRFEPKTAKLMFEIICNKSENTDQIVELVDKIKQLDNDLLNYCYAKMYLKGICVEKSLEKSLLYYEKLLKTNYYEIEQHCNILWELHSKTALKKLNNIVLNSKIKNDTVYLMRARCNLLDTGPNTDYFLAAKNYYMAYYYGNVNAISELYKSVNGHIIKKNWSANYKIFKKGSTNELTADSKFNILFVSSMEYLKYSKVLLKSIVVNNPNVPIRLFIATSNPDNLKMQNFLEYASELNVEVSFIINEFNDKFEYINIKKNIPRSILFRLVPHLFLPEDVHRLLSIDSDTIVCGNLLPLYNMDLGSNFIAAARDSRTFPLYYGNGCYGYSYFNTGVCLYDIDKFRKSKINYKTYDNLVLEKVYGKYSQEEMIMNYVYSGKVSYISPVEYNHTNKINDYVIEAGINEKPSVIHYYSEHKPWKYPMTRNVIPNRELIKIWWEYESDMLKNHNNKEI